MGIKNLNALIKTHSLRGVNKVNLKSYENKTLGIDAMLYLYKFLYGNKNHIDGLFFQVNKLKKFKIKPVFIFEGKPPKEKEKTLVKRRKNKLKIKSKIQTLKENIEEIENDVTKNMEEKQLAREFILKQIDNLDKGLVYIDDNIISSCKKLLEYMGISYIVAPCEAEQYCAVLSKNNLIDAVLSDDMDTLAFGANIVLREFSNRSDYVMEYDLKNIISEMSLNYSRFIDLSILCGNDYVGRLKGFNHYEIFNLIKEHQNIEKLIDKKIIVSKTIDDYNKLRDIYNSKNIYILDTDIEAIRFQPSYNIAMLKNFLSQNSSIDKQTYMYRISMIYYRKNKFKINKNYFSKLSGRKI